MIRVEVYCQHDAIQKICMKGHARYANFGKDIVCSAASTCLITTVNGISEIDPKYLVVDQQKDHVMLYVQKENGICSKLLSNMIAILKELEEQYPQNISVKCKEGNDE